MNLTPQEIYLAGLCNGILGGCLMAWVVCLMLSMLFGGIYFFGSYEHGGTHERDIRFKWPFFIALTGLILSTLVGMLVPTSDKMREIFIAAHQTQEAAK